MKHKIVQLIIILIFLLLQTAALAVFPNASIWFPQLILIYVIAYALNNSFVRTAWLSFGAGLLSELYSTFYFGSSTLAFFLTGVFIYFVTRRLTSQDVSLTTLILLAIPATLFFPVWAYLYGGLLYLIGISDSILFSDFYSVTILWSALSNLIFLYPVNTLYVISSKR